MSQQKRVSYKTEELGYIDGNTVKKAQALPAQHGEEVHRALEEKQRADREREERQRQARLTARKNQQKAMQMSRGYVAFLLAAVAVMVGVCTVYLQMQFQASAKLKAISSLESQVMDLKTENDATLQRIDTSLDMEQVRQTAVGELGMVYPGEGQIQYFHVDPTDYMNQYEDIPEK